MRDVPIIIVGAGPAGLTAAMQLTRLGVDVTIFESHRAGGLLHQAYRVDNYPGQCIGIAGSVLASRITQHAEVMGVTIRYEKVSSISTSENAFMVSIADETLFAKAVILATGTTPIAWSDGAIDHAARDRIHYHVSELRECADEHIAIVGAGDAAYDYALTLATRNRVTILQRHSDARAHMRLQNEVASHGNITRCTCAKVKSIAACNDHRIVLDIEQSQCSQAMCVDRVVFAVGRQPNLTVLEPSLNVTAMNCIEKSQIDANCVKVVENGQATLYCIGDIIHGRCRQTACAVGDGMIVAMKIASQLGRV